MARPTPKPTARDDLVRLATMLDEGFAGRGWHSQPGVLIHTTSIDDGSTFHLGLADLDGHPLDALVGTVAPDHWDACGASQLGWATPVQPDPPNGESQRRRRVRATSLVSRTAGEVTLLRFEDAGTAIEAPEEARGLVPDALRRCLHLPTPPPDVPVATFFTAVWFGAVRAVGAASSRPLGWEQLQSLHPSHHPGRPLAVTAREQASGIGWDGLRWQTVERRWVVPSVSPELAAWFDDGSFARWIQPSSADLAAVTGLATRDAVLRMARLLGDLGVW